MHPNQTNGKWVWGGSGHVSQKKKLEEEEKKKKKKRKKRKERKERKKETKGRNLACNVVLCNLS